MEATNLDPPTVKSADSADSWVDAFESAWLRGARPKIGEYLPATESFADGTDRHELLCELVKVDLEFRWRSAAPTLALDSLPARPLIEHYVARHPSLRSPTVDLVVEEYRARIHWGDKPTIDSYAERFPNLAKALRSELPAVDQEFQREVLTRPRSIERLTSLFTPPKSSDSGETILPRIPGYELLGVVGRGSMGVVYKARQSGLNRLVAIKMIHAGAAACDLDRARFRVEAEAAAALHHPHIVQIYDVGEHENCPYVVLELVEGGTLAQALGRRAIDPRDAAAVIETLARAIHEAHHRGIIHRDLKPANILLAGREASSRSAEGDPGPPPWNPKIGDFGLAKWLEGTIATNREPALFATITGAILGTPGYMAPEQASGDLAKIGPATDIHALGAILYQSLVRRPPYLAASWIETIEHIRDSPPPSPRKLAPDIPKDLDTICMKCLEKDSRKRYQSALDLADDLRRFQAGETVSARPVGPIKKAGRWARRKPAIAALSGLFALALASLAGVWVSSDLKLRSAYRLANDRGGRAERNFQAAFDAVKQIIQKANAPELVNTPESESFRRNMLAEALKFIERLTSDNGDHRPETTLQTGAARCQAGIILGLMGRGTEALEEYAKALDLLKPLAEEPRAADSTLDEYARCEYELAHQLIGMIDPPQPHGPHLDRAIAVWRELAPGNRFAELNLANALSLGAMSLQNDASMTESRYREAITILERLAGEGGVRERQSLAMSLYNLGLLKLQRENLPKEAGALFRKAIAVWDLIPEDQRDAWFWNQYAEGLTSMAYVEKDRAGAVADLEKAIKIREKTAREHAGVLEMRWSLARSYNSLGQIELSYERREAAVAAFEKSAALREQALVDFNQTRNDPLSLTALAESLSNLALTLDSLGKAAEASRRYERAFALVEKSPERFPGNGRVLSAASSVCINYANHERDRGAFKRALELNQLAALYAEQARKVLGAYAATDQAIVNARGSRALTYEAMKDFERAADDWRALVKTAEASARPFMSLSLALCLARDGRIEESERLAAVELAEATPQMPPGYFYNWACAAAILSAKTDTGSDDGIKRASARAEKAMKLLDRAAAAGMFRTQSGLDLLRTDPDLDPLRARPDFQALAESAARDFKASSAQPPPTKTTQPH